MSRNREVDETDSTRQFAEDVESNSNHSGDYEQPHAGDWRGPQTLISGGPRYAQPSPRAEGCTEFSGIHMMNEMSVSYEKS